MYKFLFRSRWIAAIWAIATLGSIAAFVAEGGGQERIAKAADEIRANQQPMLVGGTGEKLVIDEAGVDDGFTDDKQLLDNSGDDEDASGDSEADGGDTYVILDKSAPVNQSAGEEAVEESFQRQEPGLQRVGTGASPE